MNNFTDNMKLTQVIDIGEMVICDVCNEDYSNSNESGGFIFTSKAYCPKCAKKRLPEIKGYGEEKYIKAYCPSTMSFKDMVLAWRCGNNTIKFYEDKK